MSEVDRVGPPGFGGLANATAAERASAQAPARTAITRRGTPMAAPSVEGTSRSKIPGSAVAIHRESPVGRHSATTQGLTALRRPRQLLLLYHLSAAVLARREGFEPPTARSIACLWGAQRR